MEYKYFRDPDNFAYKIDKAANCSVCGKVGIWFDAGGFYGINEIECICDSCLSEGTLRELEIETNEASDGTDEEKDEIIYRTPALPTWQDRIWPFVNGQYCVFERIASKADFENEEDFKSSFLDRDRENADLEWLWSILPEKRIANYKDGNFDVSVYLFTCNGKKYCTWDAN
jgi:uncharacterized protein CbrC (UPF0167 family)